jgi:hypothetical protein
MTKVNGFNDSPKSFDGSRSIAWFAIYAAIGLTISFIIPFPLSLLFSFGIVMLLQTYRVGFTKKRFQSTTTTNTTTTIPISKTPNTRMSKWSLRRLIESISPKLFDDPYEYFGYQPLRLCCMDCGKEHRKRSCPSCGSMAVRIG